MTTVDRGAGRILVVDDDPTTRMLARATLEKSGLTVVEGVNGHEAIELATESTPDLILLDVEMPELDGFEACARIRSRPEIAEIPIIMLTGREDDESIKAAYDSGATDFVAKPVSWPLLTHRVRYVLRGSRESWVLAESKNKNRAFVKAIPDSMIVVDKKGIVRSHQRGKDGNAAFDRMLCVGQTVFDALPAGFATSWKHSIRHVLDKGAIQQFETSFSQGKTVVYFDVRMVPFTRKQVLVIMRDVSVQKRADAKVRRLAFFDTLTGLPNRQSFLIQLSEMIRQCAGTDRQFSVLYVDLDNFKRINDTLGHTVGDALLKATARRIESCIRKQDHVSRLTKSAAQTQVARLGGDEFTLLLRDVHSNDDAEAVAGRIAAALRRPLVHAGQEFVITPSIGIATYPEDGEDIDTLVANANIAMYHSKEAGRDRFTQFSGTMSVRSLERLDLEDALRRAIREDALDLHYQPKLCLRTQAVKGVEALLRWTHPERGPVSPGKFIPIAEDSGLINDLGDWVLNTACDQLAAWRATDALKSIRIAINLSGKQFVASDIDQRILDAVENRGLDVSSLELELTESTLMETDENAIKVVSRLSAAGFELAIDDFGTGYSSLSYLTRFPIRTLKIDRSFVHRISTDPKSASLCTAIIAMAHSLGLNVVAEGVETTEQLRSLIERNCDEIQGYFFAEPMTAATFEDFVENRCVCDVTSLLAGPAEAAS